MRCWVKVQYHGDVAASTSDFGTRAEVVVLFLIETRVLLQGAAAIVTDEKNILGLCTRGLRGEPINVDATYLVVAVVDIDIAADP